MRNLTLIRKKSPIACTCAVYLYLSCTPAEATILLEEVPCKLVGKLKNGKSTVLEIPSDPITLFVAYSRTFPDAYHASYQIPFGEQEVSLMTRPHLNPFAGNPFTIEACPK